MNATTSGIAAGIVIAALTYGAGWVAGVSYAVHQQAAEKTQQMADAPRCADVYNERARKAYALPACRAGES